MGATDVHPGHTGFDQVTIKNRLTKKKHLQRLINYYTYIYVSFKEQDVEMYSAIENEVGQVKTDCITLFTRQV